MSFVEGKMKTFVEHLAKIIIFGTNVQFSLAITNLVIYLASRPN